MGEMISFTASEGDHYKGYLAPSKSGSGPGVIVIQEWWGLVGHIKDVADRFAAEGFTALAPDFYKGETTTEPDEAGSLMMALNISETANILQKAILTLLAHPTVTGDGVGVVGFCMGGQLSLFAAAQTDEIGACVDYYGIHPKVDVSYRDINCPVLGFFAEHDDYASPEAVKAKDVSLSSFGKPHEFITYPGTHHAFFNSDRPEVYNREAAEDSWKRMVEFFRKNLG